MRSGDNSSNYFSENQLTKLAHLVQFKRVLMSGMRDWGWVGAGPFPPLTTPLLRDGTWRIMYLYDADREQRVRGVGAAVPGCSSPV